MANFLHLVFVMLIIIYVCLKTHSDFNEFKEFSKITYKQESQITDQKLEGSYVNLNSTMLLSL